MCGSLEDLLRSHDDNEILWYKHTRSDKQWEIYLSLQIGFQAQMNVNKRVHVDCQGLNTAPVNP